MTMKTTRRESEHAGVYGARYSGWVFARELIDNDGKKKLFTYYPCEEHGKPPYLYDTKVQAVAAMRKALNSKEYLGKWPFDQSDVKLVKYQPRMYLDRY